MAATDIRVFSDDETVTCEKCGGRCDIDNEPSSKDDDGPIFKGRCLRCDEPFLVQFEDEEEREITGDGEEEAVEG